MHLQRLGESGDGREKALLEADERQPHEPCLARADVRGLGAQRLPVIQQHPRQLKFRRVFREVLDDEGLDLALGEFRAKKTEV